MRKYVGLAVAVVMAFVVHAPSSMASNVGAVHGLRMSVTAIDTDQAERAGNTVAFEDGYKVLREGGTGREIARTKQHPEHASESGGDPADTKAAAGRSRESLPKNEVPGNCGTSWFYLFDKGNHRAQFWTGFELNGIAYDFDWHIDVVDGWGFEYRWEDHGPLNNRARWEARKAFWVDRVARHNGRVTAGTAYLADGRICDSGGPSDNVPIN